MADDPFLSPDESSLSVLLDENVVERRRLKGSFSSAFRAGIRDLRRSRVLALSTAVTAFIAALAVMAAPLLDQLVTAGEAHVAHNSEIIVFMASGPSSEIARSVERITQVRGVEGIEPSTQDDLAALPPTMILAAQQRQPYTLHPTGYVPLDVIQAELRQIPHVENSALALGVHSMAAIRLTAEMIPWLAGILVVFGLIMMANLAFMSGRTRRGEVEAMNLVGGDPLSVWVSTATVIVVPTVIVVFITTTAVVLLAPWIASLFLPTEAAAQVAGTGLLPHGLLLVAGAVVVAAGLTYLGAQVTPNSGR